jgi:hypothetical protein
MKRTQILPKPHIFCASCGVYVAPLLGKEGKRPGGGSLLTHKLPINNSAPRDIEDSFRRIVGSICRCAVPIDSATAELEVPLGARRRGGKKAPRILDLRVSAEERRFLM